MNLNNTNRALKRPAEKELISGATTSNKILKFDSSEGTVYNGEGNATYNAYENQPTYQQPPRGIQFQVQNPVTSFCGRDTELQYIKNAFNKPKEKKQYNLVVVSGYGGIGKTQLVRKYIQQNQKDFDNIVWISAEFEVNIRDSFDKLQELFKDMGYYCSGHQDVYKRLTNTNCLFIFDEVENMKDIRSFLPDGNNDSLFLITSRFVTWSPYESIKLDIILNPKGAADLIKSVLDENQIVINENQLEKISNLFEPIPLVLQIVTGFMCQKIHKLKILGKECNINDIIEELNTEYASVAQPITPPPFHDSYANSIFQAISQSLEKIVSKKDIISINAVKILGLSSYLNNDDINKELLKNILNIKNDNLFHESLDILQKFSLVMVTNDIVMIHRIVQQCVRHFCTKIMKTNEHYLLALSVLLTDNIEYWPHHRIVAKNAEEDKETFLTFYEKYKCHALHRVVAESITPDTLSCLLDKSNSFLNPEFLCEAVACDRDGIMQILQTRNTDFNIIDEKGFNALHYACLPRKYDTLTRTSKRIQILMQHNVKVNFKNICGNTILHNLCEFGNNNSSKDEYVFKISSLIIRHKADFKLKNDAKQTASDLALKYGLKLTFKLLNTVMSDGLKIAHIAAENKQFQFLEWLIEHEICDINERDHSGNTILHMLAGIAIKDNDDAETVDIFNIIVDLVNLKANVTLENKDGLTAGKIAQYCKWEKLSYFLNTRVPPGDNIYRIHRNKFEDFSFIQNKCNVNKTNKSGHTIINVLCSLERDIDLEEDIVKLAVDLVIQYKADVFGTVADVARNRGRRLLAEFLDSLDYTAENLIYIAIKYQQFGLTKDAWWRYIYSPSASHENMYGYIDQSGCRVLHMLCGLKDPNVSDTALISVISVLDLRQVKRYLKNEYHNAAKAAKKHNRKRLYLALKRFEKSAEATMSQPAYTNYNYTVGAISVSSGNSNVTYRKITAESHNP